MPFINGRFHINPAQGRAVEAARAANAAAKARPGQEDGDGNAGHWVTIHGRHVFIEDSRQKIAKIARKYRGSTNWAFGKRKDNFPPNTDKCNKFVYDVTREAGAEPLVRGSDGKLRPPLAAEWANPNLDIPNWIVLTPEEKPQPGDVAAYPIPGHHTYTGHSGIVTSVDADGRVHAIAAHEDLVGPDDKFNRSDRAVTYRRFTGDQR